MKSWKLIQVFVSITFLNQTVTVISVFAIMIMFIAGLMLEGLCDIWRILKYKFFLRRSNDFQQTGGNVLIWFLNKNYSPPKSE